ncbi:MAG TPA: molybdenum cofactor biosynthesis protein MoaE [Bryobacteraceae bacterium]|nr:molybdenum cofactor biosynthesis protein MoaE [Bryobacteraceae bacterium]
MKIRVLFFGQLKDYVGHGEEQLEVAAGSALENVWRHYEQMHPALAALRRGVVFARNHEFSNPGTELADGDEVAFLPPVSGGSDRYTQVIEDGGQFYALTRQPIDMLELRRRVLRDDDGAITSFEGVVRNNTKGRATKFLDYECYEEMATRVMAQIGREIASAYAIGRLAMVHRLGRMEIGDTSVAIVASAPHRKPSFDAALDGINKLKKLVPIWKKEHFVDGEVWVEGEWDDSLLVR